eukprot:GSMAST32.ASY1.ANO1.2523.1 assembled CDS
MLRQRQRPSFRGAVQIDHQWQIEFSRLNILEKVASGASGQVFKAEYLGVPLAVKQIFSTMISEDLDEFSRELSLLAKVDRHPNVVRLMGIAKEKPKQKLPPSLYICMEWVNENMEKLLEDSKRAPKDLSQVNDLKIVLRLAQQVCAAMVHLHRQRCLHRDLKPANVLITPEMHVKVCDFGVSNLGSNIFRKSKGKRMQLASGVGTPGYMAPEMYSAEPVVGFEANAKVDVFAFGVLLASLCTSNRPYGNEISELSQWWSIDRWTVAMQNEGLVPYLEPSCKVPKQLADLIGQCCDFDPLSRPSFKRISSYLARISKTSLPRETLE